MPAEGALGASLVGEKVIVNNLQLTVTKFLGEGGFAYVYVVKEASESADNATPLKRSTKKTETADETSKNKKEKSEELMVLKVTSILSRQQKDIAEKEAKLLSRLSHPSIVKMHDHCYRTTKSTSTRPQHCILMELCDGGHALSVCTQLVQNKERFDLSALIIAFGQICNAVSYLHAQRPPIVHRDLKPENFLIKNGAYKLCDFGSAVFGHVELKTSKDRADAEEVIEKTTTQMFRAPEMVDLYMAKKLTQATDVWALGCCLFSLAFLKNCFEEGSNLAILSRNYKIPDDNPYGDGIVELLDRMLTEDSKARADMTEVILCLSAVYSGKPLPPQKERKSKEKDPEKKEKKKSGKYRTDGQGIQQDLTIDPKNQSKKEAKKLDPNSAAARRRQAADMEFANFHSKFDDIRGKDDANGFNEDLAFSTSANPFAGGVDTSGTNENFASFNDSGTFDAWDNNDDNGDGGRRSRSDKPEQPKKTRSRSQDHRRRTRKPKDETPEEAIDRLAAEDEEAEALAQAVNNSADNNKKRVVARRQVRRTPSSKSGSSDRARSHSRGSGLRRSKSGRAAPRKEGGTQCDNSDSEED